MNEAIIFFLGAMGGVSVSASDFDDGFSDGSADDTAVADDLF